MNDSESKTRTKQFALRVMKLMDALPQNAVGRPIGSQLIRSATSVGANYRAACEGRSKADFVSKLNIVFDEADESCYWLEKFIIEGALLPKEKFKSLLDDANQITATMFASRKTEKCE